MQIPFARQPKWGFHLPALILAGLLSAGTSVQTARAQDDGAELMGLVVELLNESDPDLRGLAYEQIRNELPGQQATRQLGALLDQVTGEAQIGLLRALGQRGDQAAAASIRKVLNAPPSAAAKVAAIAALGNVGDSSDCAALAKLIGDQQPTAIRGAARRAFVTLPGPAVVDSIVQLLKTAKPATKVHLIDLLAERRAMSARSELVKQALSSDAQVRRAAMNALGKIGEAEQIPGMVKGVLKAERGSERAAAEKNVMFVCQRIPDRNERAEPLLAAMNRLNSKDRTILLSTLGRVGGDKAMQVVKAAVKDRRTHSDGIRALANWPDSTVATELINLAKSDAHASHRITALRALIRIAPLPDGRSDEEKLTLLKTSMKLCQRDEERIYTLKRAAAIRILDTLRFLMPYLDQPKFAETACLSIVELAHHRNLREPNREEFHAALDQVMATSKNAIVLERAKRYKSDRTWVRGQQ